VCKTCSEKILDKDGNEIEKQFDEFHKIENNQIQFNCEEIIKVDIVDMISTQM